MFANQANAAPIISPPPPAGHVRLQFELVPSSPNLGDIVEFNITMNLDAGWHTYSISQKKMNGLTPTVITLKAGKNLRPIGNVFRPDHPPEIVGGSEIYTNKVIWTRRFKFEPTSGSDIGISGSVYYGLCSKSSCLPPKTIDFTLGAIGTTGTLPPVIPEIVPTEEAGPGLWFYLGTAFLGGILLNVMPCVLPVLVIKVLSFLQQAGESRIRVFLLNLAYSIGVIFVFLVLASLVVGTRAAAGHFSWGGLFGETYFDLAMACLVFAMGLSLLGVFEIPLPGMIGSVAGQHQKEGLIGACLTGIFATLLATPCTGPFMGAAIGWAGQQPWLIVYLIFGVMGFGMACPYLILALFPRLIQWLPKPGGWMVRFKEFAGFILLCSVIFIVYYTESKFTIPLLIMLVGVGLGVWMIGNLYNFSSKTRQKVIVRLSALFLTASICWAGFNLAGNAEYPLPWEPFSDMKMETLMKEHKIILIDFYADWCVNCHWNEVAALNTKETLDIVKKNHIITLKADFTKQPPELQRWLAKFKQDGVPLTVIFPTNRETKPIVLTGVYTKAILLEKLEEAAK